VKTYKSLIGAALALSTLLLSILLTSCGGGGTFASSGGVGTGGTGISMGTVTGFGSVVVDGTAYNSATPNYFAGTDQSEAAQAPSTAVDLGDQLQVRLDSQGNPSTVLIEPELMGVVANLDASGSGFTVNGVAVRVNANPAAGPVTYYTGLSGYSGLSNGMQVGVHGSYGVDASGQGYIQATRIEQLPATNPVARVTGVVAKLNPATGTFQIGSTIVQTGASTAVEPSQASLANGQLVNVWSRAQPSGNVIAADLIRIHTLQGTAGAVQVGGLVAARSGASFQVDGIPVDASDPSLASVVQGLTLGEYVVVQGQIDGASGVVKASSIRSYAANPSQVELRGTITGFVSASSFLVRGVPVDASGQGVVFTGGSVASLGNGVFVDIVGNVASGGGNVVTASSIALLPNPGDGETVDYQGTVSTFNASAHTFTLTWQSEGAAHMASVILASNVVYSNGSASQLINGASVEIEATNTAGGLMAYSVSFPGGDGGSTSATLETKGTLYGLNATSFMVNNVQIQIGSATIKPQGTVLADGQSVEVSFTQPSGPGGPNLAQEISIDQ
jgi:hypothetical protein